MTAALAPLLIAPLARGKAPLRERVSDLRLFGGAWRALHRAGLEEALRLLPMNVRDVLDERLTDDALKAAVAAPALQSSFMGPRSAGSFWNLLWHRPAWMPHLLAPPRQAAGGPGAFAAALGAAARAAGVVIRTGAAVERITVGQSGVRGVVLDGGVELAAARVVSALDPRRTLLGLLEPGLLDVEVSAEIESLRGRGNVAIARLALDRAAALRRRRRRGAGGPDPDRRSARRPRARSTTPASTVASPSVPRSRSRCRRSPIRRSPRPARRWSTSGCSSRRTGLATPAAPR